VYRCHMLPIMCQRCSTEFKSHSDLQKHYRSTVGCKPRPSDLEGCSALQKTELRCRKDNSGKTEIEKWKDMYRILFSKHERIPSPCKSSGSRHSTSNDSIVCQKGNCCRKALEKFKEEYIVSELPLKIHQDIGTNFTLRIGKTKSRLKEVIGNHADQLLRSFLDRELGPRLESQNSKTGLKPLRRDRLTVPLYGDSGLSPNAFPRSAHLPTRNPRRRAHSELSTSPK
jgi:hypothetical protein